MGFLGHRRHRVDVYTDRDREAEQAPIIWAIRYFLLPLIVAGLEQAPIIWAIRYFLLPLIVAGLVYVYTVDVILTVIAGVIVLGIIIYIRRRVVK